MFRKLNKLKNFFNCYPISYQRYFDLFIVTNDLKPFSKWRVLSLVIFCIDFWHACVNGMVIDCQGFQHCVELSGTVSTTGFSRLAIDSFAPDMAVQVWFVAAEMMSLLEIFKIAVPAWSASRWRPPTSRSAFVASSTTRTPRRTGKGNSGPWLHCSDPCDKSRYSTVLPVWSGKYKNTLSGKCYQKCKILKMITLSGFYKN